MSARARRVRAAIGWALALGLIAASVAQAQDRTRDDNTTTIAPAPPMAPQSGAVDPERYRLGPGDVLVLLVWGPVTMNHALEVSPDGYVFVPSMGSVRVTSQTLAQVRHDLERMVKKQYRSVQVEVRLQRVRSFVVYLTGEVRDPGPRFVRGAGRVGDVVVDTLLTPAASRRNLVVKHSDSTETRADLGLFQRTGRGGGDEPLRDGDVIHVPAAMEFVGIWGGVARPGRYEYNPGDSLSTLIAIGGGTLPSVDRDRGVLIRWVSPTVRETVAVSVAEIETGRNLPVRPGDDLYLYYDPEYRRSHQVEVVGFVMRAGGQPIVPGVTRFSAAIEGAGGFRPEANLSAIRLIRRVDGVGDDVEFQRLARLSREEMTDSEYEVFRTRLASLNPDFRVDWNRVSGDTARDPVLLDGDIIRVDRMTNTVRVDGQVRRPGVFEHEPGKPWGYYLELAGGWGDRAAHTKVRVTHTINGQSTLVRSSEPIMPGDFIWVPERSDVTTWDHLKELLIVAAAVATIVIAFRGP